MLVATDHDAIIRNIESMLEVAAYATDAPLDGVKFGELCLELDAAKAAKAFSDPAIDVDEAAGMLTGLVDDKAVVGFVNASFNVNKAAQVLAEVECEHAAYILGNDCLDVTTAAKSMSAMDTCKAARLFSSCIDVLWKTKKITDILSRVDRERWAAILNHPALDIDKAGETLGMVTLGVDTAANILSSDCIHASRIIQVPTPMRRALRQRMLDSIYMDSGRVADIFDKLEPGRVAEIFGNPELDTDMAADILDDVMLGADKAVAVLKAVEILNNMRAGKAAEVVNHSSMTPHKAREIFRNLALRVDQAVEIFEEILLDKLAEILAGFGGVPRATSIIDAMDPARLHEVTDVLMTMGFQAQVVSKKRSATRRRGAASARNAKKTRKTQ